MALINRISRLFAADLNAVLDRMEEPEILLKQAIRDMQVSVAAAERQAAALDSRAEEISAATRSAEARLAECEAALGVCLDAGDDDLARSVIHKRLQLESVVAELTSRSARVNKALDEQRQRLGQHQQELEALRSKADVLETPERTGIGCPSVPRVTAEDVEVALLQEKQRRARS